MSTIAKYVAEMEVDPTGVKVGLDRAEGYVRQFSKTANNVLTPRTIGTGGSFFDSIEKSVEATLPSLNKIAPAHDKAAHAAEGHHLSINRLEHALAGFAAHATGTNHVLATMGGAFLNFGLGGIWTIAILSGIAILIAVWEQYTEKVREARKAMEEFGKTDEAFAARSRAQSTIVATLSTVRGGFGKMIDVEGITEGIDKAEKAVKGFEHELEKTSNVFTGSTRAPVVAIEALRKQFLGGTIDAHKLAIELTSIAVDRPEYGRMIAKTLELANGLEAARDAVIRLTAAEEHRLAILDETTRRGPLGELTKSLDNAERRLAALQRGGEPALKAEEREQKATEDATKAWDSYATSKAGAAFASLTFTDALRELNPVAIQAYNTALKLAEANDKIAAGLKNPLDAIEKTTSAILGWHAAAKQAGTLTSIFSPKIADAIIEVGKLFDKETDKMSDNAIRLQAILAKLTEAFLQLGALAGPSFTPTALPTAITSPGVSSLLRGGSASTAGLIGPRGGPGFTLPQPRAATLAPDALSFNRAKLNAALTQLEDGAKGAARGLLDMVASGGLAVLKNIVSQLNPFALIVKSLGDAMTPLEPVLLTIANIIGTTLRPVFVALAPIIAAFIPFFRALLQIVAPLVRALLPILSAFVPILEALFPIIKFVAIAFTYVVQAAAEVASILLRMAGNVVVVFGIILKGLATAIDKLPFVSAKGAINAAQGLIDFGHGLLDASDAFKKTADGMVQARKDIGAVNIDHTVDSIDQLGDAAAKTSAALLNVPTWYKIALNRFKSADAIGGGVDTSKINPLDHNPTSRDHPKLGGSTTGGSDTGGVGKPGGGVAIHGDIYVDARQQSAAELFDAILEEGRKRARATLGDASRWSELQA